MATHWAECEGGDNGGGESKMARRFGRCEDGVEEDDVRQRVMKG